MVIVRPARGIRPPSPVKPRLGGVTVSQYEDLLIDVLLDHGFSVEEAERLIALQNKLQRRRQQREFNASCLEWPEPDGENNWN